MEGNLPSPRPSILDASNTQKAAVLLSLSSWLAYGGCCENYNPPPHNECRPVHEKTATCVTTQRLPDAKLYRIVPKRSDSQPFQRQRPQTHGSTLHQPYRGAEKRGSPSPSVRTSISTSSIPHARTGEVQVPAVSVQR
ncbi:hypothetical protein P154DRAFT_526231 [Amniculicola lignicola CBS 123094]|uniref:Uncharacterized protein n=1 Tax=Amniculicola lignicola CBS 123094 TaxID=1392246 RepID=A0A6A5W0R3_9PLEO|nr:hypothetical protein P154DRAFT_526231 [Amniculicola lignicola CBS 123094]